MKKSFNKIVCVLLIVLMLFLITSCGKKTEVETYDRGNFFNYGNPSASYYSTSWTYGSNVGKLDNSVSNIARAKYTNIKGNGKDIVTILVYMCGTDLESDGKMASYDLQEMAQADLGSNVNLIVYTGGCTRWHISEISTKYNQIYQVLGNGKVQCLVENAGTGTMVDPANLTAFIEFGEKNFPADRYELILWDHGSGTVSGYGYDEKYPSAGSMDLSEIDEALTDADLKFDFIGFDACLMANVETALMLSEHADYMIASEESEPGIGWYYTDWLNALAKNTSMSTIEIGKNICDTFVSDCNRKVPRQGATLSVVDLAEASAIIPSVLSAFSKNTTDLINGGNYKTIVSARRGSREFAQSSKVDLVDFVSLAKGIGTDEANELADALLSCVKYNNTSGSMSDSYGLSVYFPYQTTRYVNTVLNVYDEIGFNSDYANCVKSFVTYSGSGQVASGGTHQAQQSFGSYSGSSQYQQQSSSEDIYDIISQFIGGGYSSGTPQSGSSNGEQGQNQGSSNQQSIYSQLLSYEINYLIGSLFNRNVAEYIAENHFDVDLSFKDGKINVSEKQWSMITDLRLSMFIDDGEGYIDLGNDFIFDTDDKGNILKIDESEMTWLAASVDGEKWQVVPYYYTSSTVDGTNVITTGRIPALVNGKLADLIVYIDDNTIEIVGVSYIADNDTAVVAKSTSGLNEGDEIEFVCDYYDYSGNLVNNYVLGEKVTVVDELKIGDVSISSMKYLASYQITDIYGQVYWSEPMNK